MVAGNANPGTPAHTRDFPPSVRARSFEFGLSHGLNEGLNHGLNQGLNQGLSHGLHPPLREQDLLAKTCMEGREGIFVETGRFPVAARLRPYDAERSTRERRRAVASSGTRKAAEEQAMTEEGASRESRPNAGPAVAAGAAGATAPQVWSVRALLGWIVPYLKERGVDSPRAVAEILLSDVLRVERLRLYMEPDRELEPGELAALRSLVARAGRHEPVQFLVGSWPFLGRDFEVAPCTLIPRPCTETLVERALAWYRARGAGPVRALDLCTGSGCIAVSLALGMRAILRPDGSGCRPVAAGGRATSASARPSLPTIDISTPASQASEARAPAEPVETPIRIVATDIVPDAAALARRNAARLGAEVEVRAGDMWSPIHAAERFDLVASNPPYVTDDEYEALDRNVKEYEPASALRGGADGLDFIKRVVSGAERHLDAGGLLLVEIGWKHRSPALRLVSTPRWRDAEVLADGEGIDRVLVAVRTDSV